MLQQIIALFIIAFFIWRLSAQRKKNKINKKEFYLWLIFWLLAITAIIFIKQIDAVVNWLGFSSGGINFLLYLTVMGLFYLVFKLRLNLAKLDANLTKIARKIALDDEEKSNQ